MSISYLDILKSRRNFWYFILSLTSIRLIYIFFIPITPQEAYYWYYAQYLDLSYFDHPPMAAYSIWLGTHLFGNTVFGVKFIGLVWSLLTNILLYFTTINAVGLCEKNTLSEHPEYQNVTAFLAVILYNLSIFAHLYAITLMPDTPLLFFWLLTIYWFQQRDCTGRTVYYILAGVALGFALMSKYTAVALVPALFAYNLIHKENRKSFLSLGPYLLILTSLVVFLPVVYWNYKHHWASFIFQFGNRAEQVHSFTLTYMEQLVFSQVFELLPLLFVFIPRTVFSVLKKPSEESRSAFFIISGLFIVFGFIMISITTLVKMNWLLPGYLGMIIAVALLFRTEFVKPSRWMKIGIYTSIVLIVLAHIIFIVPDIPLGEGNTWSGWKDAAQRIYTIQQKMGGQKDCFIFANSYKSASLLKFYIPDKQDIYAQNIYGRPALQFDIWGVPGELTGQNALYVCDDRKEYKNDLNQISNYFDKVVLYKKFEYKSVNSQPVRIIFCYLAYNYSGNKQSKKAVHPKSRVSGNSTVPVPALTEIIQE